jgi:hypothetical protein
MNPQEMRDWIDQASYEELLRKWRFAPAGDPFFRGEIGDYYSKIMHARREEISAEDCARASKRIGWEK